MEDNTVNIANSPPLIECFCCGTLFLDREMDIVFSSFIVPRYRCKFCTKLEFYEFDLKEPVENERTDV